MRRDDMLNEIARAAFFRKQARAAKMAGRNSEAHRLWREARVRMARASCIELDNSATIFRYPAPERAY